MEALAILRIILEEGAKYAILAMGVYLTYSILDFPDMTVDGTVPLGAILSAVLILHGVDPWLAALCAFLGGAAAGCVTGLLHVKLGIRPLLCGILTYTACLTGNLILAKVGTGGQSIVSIFGCDTVFTSGIARWIPESAGGVSVRRLLLLWAIVIAVKLCLDRYLRSGSGMLLRATGNNEHYTVTLAKDPGNAKILGLAIGNGLASLSGAVIAQANESANTSMGQGMVVFGLSSVIIGIALFGRLGRMRGTTLVILGNLIYKAFLQLATSLGLPSDYNKLLMAGLFVAALVVSRTMKKGGRVHAAT